MSYRIQVTVDEHLNKVIKLRAEQMGLSVSSFARLALMNALPTKKSKLLNEALADIRHGDIESLTLTEFKKQIDEL